MRTSLLVMFILWACAGLANADTPKPVLALKGLDPIALAEGQEIAGKDSIEARFGLFQYKFANEDNKKAFLRDPEAHGVQFGGACGKMGPFSGMGSPERFFVFEKRIYVFASESCRESFKKAPREYIEAPNAIPKGTDEERRQGGELVELALQGFGGRERVDELKTLDMYEDYLYAQGDKKLRYHHAVRCRFPLEIIMEDGLNPNLYGFVVKDDKAMQFEKQSHWLVESQVRDVARRQVLRIPIVMLKNRDHKEFVAFARPDVKVGDQWVKQVEVALHGAACLWSIEPQTGQVIEVKYHARNGKNGDFLVAYSDYAQAGTLKMPRVRRVHFNGKEITSPEIVHVRDMVNAPFFMPHNIPFIDEVSAESAK